jgi:uncharacterized repeat protein (TIGR03803 family)
MSAAALMVMSIVSLPAAAGQKKNTTAPQYSIVHNFAGRPHDGALPGYVRGASLLALPNGMIYGTTNIGGSGVNPPTGAGAVFQLAPNDAFSLIYSFSPPNQNPIYPTGGLVADKTGALFGVSEYGSNLRGAVYKLSPPISGSQWTESQIFAFDTQRGDPYGEPTFGQNNVLYVTAYSSFAVPTRGGAALALTNTNFNTWQSQILHDFTGVGQDGFLPATGVVVDPMGALYGTTVLGGTANRGTVYKLTPPAQGFTQWTTTTLHSFGTTSILHDGENPYDPLIMDQAGNLFGITNYTVFKLSPPPQGQTTWTFKILYTFPDRSTSQARPGSRLILRPNGDLLGTRSHGGTWNKGIVFKLSPPAMGQTAWTFSVVHSFAGSPNDGAIPTSGITLAPSGAFYGTTTIGGTHGRGTVPCELSTRH